MGLVPDSLQEKKTRVVPAEPQRFLRPGDKHLLLFLGKGYGGHCAVESEFPQHTHRSTQLAFAPVHHQQFGDGLERRIITPIA